MKRPATIQQQIGYPPKTLVVEGATYKVGFNDQDAKGRLEEIVGAKVWDRVYAEADKMKSGERHIKRYEKLFSSGHYGTGGEGWREEVLSPQGSALFFLSLLQEHQPEMSLQDAVKLLNAEPVKCRHAIAAVAPDFFQAILRQLGATEEQIQAEAPKLAAALQDDEPQKTPDTLPNGNESMSS